MTFPVLISIALMTLMGCSGKPAQTAEKALEFWKANDYERLYDLASSKLRSQLPKDFFLSQTDRKDFPLILTYRINSSEVSAESAKVDVSITIPDFAKISTETSAAIINGTISEKEMKKIFRRGPTIERVLPMELLKESKGWRIEKFKPFDNALDLHLKIMASQAYKESIKIVSLNASRVDPELGDDLMMIEGKISNNSEEILSKVEITVKFKDDEGKVIHEAKVYPLLITGCTTADVAKHMQNSGEFKTYISMPARWTGKIEGEVTSIELGSEDMGCGSASSHAGHM